MGIRSEGPPFPLESPVLTTELLDRLSVVVAQAGSAIPADRPGLSTDAIEDLMRGAPLALPEEARLWWSWHDGFSVHLLPGRRPLALAEALEEYRTRRRLAERAAAARAQPEEFQNPDRLWDPAWLPLLQANGDAIAIDCADAVLAPVLVLGWGQFGDEDYDWPRAGSLGHMVTQWIAAIESGVFAYDRQTGRWHITDLRRAPVI